jgi:hypothetical protein
LVISAPLTVFGVTAQYLSQVGVEDSRRVLQFVGETGEVLEFTHGFLRLPHALRGRSTWC